MLKGSNLQFTNATQLNDPFDCHPGLFDYSNANTRAAKVFGKELIGRGEFVNANTLRNETWICSLSKVYNNLLMWSYYNGHKGVCIGLNKEKTKDCLSHICNGVYIGAQEMEVQYKDIIEKKDFFHGDYFENFKYQLSTKAKDWEHEQEVRFLLIDPTPSVVPHHPSFATMALPPGDKYEKAKYVDWTEVRAYPEISAECFESLYLGVRIENEDKNNIVEIARKRNPNIKIFQMKPNPEAFRLMEEEIN